MSSKRDGGMPWFRFYGGDVLGDPKLATLSDGQFRVWVNLLCLASTQSERGMIVGVGDKLLAALVARGDQQLVRETLAELEDLRVIAVDGEGDDRLIYFINFESRQYDKPSDRPERVAGRVAAFRARQRVFRNAPVTPCNAREEETDPDRDRSPEIPDGISAPLASAVVVEVAAAPPAPPAAAAPAPPPPPSRSEGDPADSSEGELPSGADALPATAAKPPKLRPIYGDDHPALQLARTLGAGIHRNKPDAKLPATAAAWQSWAREFDLMLRVDHRPREKIEAVIAYAMRSSFWRSVVFSAAQIRRKFDVIDAQRQEDSNRGQANANRSARPAYRAGGNGSNASRQGGAGYPARLPTQDEYRAYAARLGQLPAADSGAAAGEDAADAGGGNRLAGDGDTSSDERARPTQRATATG